MSGLAAVDPAPRALASLLAGLADAPPAANVAGVAVDSRRVTPGGLFMAFAGTRTHGLDHVDDAIARGASVVAWDADTDTALDVPNVRVPALARHAGTIAARFYGEPSRQLFVAGVTGTDGKTSCAWLLTQALDRLGTRCGYIGTLGFGFADDLMPATHTTPDPVGVQGWLARFVAADAAAVAFEVSSHALDQHRVDGVAFDVAVLTQVGRDHLDYHGDVERYAAAKRRLFEFDGLRSVVLNGDDAYGRAWLDDLDADVIPMVYGFGDVAALAEDHVRIVDATAHGDGLRVALQTRWGDTVIDSTLVGRFNAMNLAAVLCVLLARGVAFERAVRVMSQLPTVPGRMQRVDTRADQPLVIVDYAHTAGALEQALGAVREHARARVLCVFGCGGERDRGKRPLMGAAAVQGADRVWITSDNPRGEAPRAIADDILAGIDDAETVRVELDRERAICDAIAEACEGDVVLIAGKGHEQTQDIGGTCRAFDDRVIARRALEAA